MPQNSLFAKIFLWFWMTALFILAIVAVVDRVARSGPHFAHLRADLTRELAAYGETVRVLSDRDGFHAVKEFIDRMEKATGTRIQIFDGKGRRLAGRDDLKEVPSLVRDAAKSGRPEILFLGEANLGALRIDGVEGTRQVIAVQFPNATGALAHESPLSFSMKLFFALALSGAICYWLARRITAPILSLGAAARQLADGNLSVRVGPALGKGRDEISRLAMDFDLMAERIESLVASQRNLLSDISHELRSPLARLNVALALTRQRSGPEAKKSMDRIEQESGKLNDLIEQLMALNRCESEMTDREKVEIDLGKVVREVVDDANYEARNLNREVYVITTGNSSIAGNARLLRRAVENVVRNAVRYTREGSRVEVSLRAVENDPGGKILITVRDHGPGVPREALAHLFKPFYRVGGDRDRQTGGAGLGLAITEAAVRFHGGTVRAENASDGGLIVEMRLPAP
jgi:signal transduction histidine kinase